MRSPIKKAVLFLLPSFTFIVKKICGVQLDSMYRIFVFK